MLYKHRIVHAVEAMITDILALANPTFCYRGADGKPISLTEAAVAQDCASYVLLNDAIVEQIYTSMQPGLVRARPHLERAPESPRRPVLCSSSPCAAPPPHLRGHRPPPRGHERPRALPAGGGARARAPAQGA